MTGVCEFFAITVRFYIHSQIPKTVMISNSLKYLGTNLED